MSDTRNEERFIHIFNLRNDDALIRFGNNYSHCYNIYDKAGIMHAIKSYEDGDIPEIDWDNNWNSEITSWDDYYEDKCIDFYTIDDLKRFWEDHDC